MAKKRAGSKSGNSAPGSAQQRIEGTFDPVPDDVQSKVDEYVKTGFEFELCQEETLRNYSDDPSPCPILRQVIEVCAANVKVRWRKFNKR